MRKFQSISHSYICQLLCTFPEVAKKKTNSFVHTSTLCLNHPTFFICQMNFSGMQGARRKALQSWSSIQNTSLTLLHVLEQVTQCSKMVLPPCLQTLGPPPPVVCPVRWHCLGTNHTDQWNNAALHDLPQGFLYFLLQGRGLQQCWSYLLIKWSTWTDPLWLIYYSFLNAQSNSHLVLTSLMGPPCITHTHRHMPSVPSTAECLNFNFILASCLDSPQVHKDGST